MQIDTSFDFRTDARGKDPDTYSPTLRRYHCLLWSKPLPSGEVFTLEEDTRHKCLYHRSATREMWLSSDSIIQTFSYWPAMRPIIDQCCKEEVDDFDRIGYTIGGMMVFPAVQVDRKPTINGARGMHRKIGERFDLTLECIRRHYAGEPSPLKDVLARYCDFFALFENFSGYVDFFLLQDLVSDDYGQVRLFLPFDGFVSAPTPQTAEAYRSFMERSIVFVTARNARIARYATSSD